MRSCAIRIATGKRSTPHGISSDCLSVAVESYSLTYQCVEAFGLDDEIAWLVRPHYVRLSPHVWGAGVGLAASCISSHRPPIIRNSRNIVQPPLIEYDVGDNALRDTIFKEPIAVENGACVLPDGPGLGVELDPLAVRHFNEA